MIVHTETLAVERAMLTMMLIVIRWAYVLKVGGKRKVMKDIPYELLGVHQMMHNSKKKNKCDRERCH